MNDTAISAKTRAQDMLATVPDDARAVAVVTLNGAGAVEVRGASIGLHALTGLLVAGTLSAGEALAREADTIVTDCKTVLSGGTLSAALSSLPATATPQPAPSQPTKLEAQAGATTEPLELKPDAIIADADPAPAPQATLPDPVLAASANG